jgi:hypothetical protein
MTTLQNLYADPNVNASGYGVTNRSRNVRQGADVQTMTNFYSVSGSDSVNSVYRMFKNLDANFVPTAIYLGCTAMTSLAISVGLYLPNLSLVTAPASGGAAIFLAATSIAAGFASLSQKTALDCMSTYWAATGTFTQMDNRLFEIGGYGLAPTASTYTTPRQFDLCITVTTTTAVAGVIGMVLEGYMG